MDKYCNSPEVCEWFNLLQGKCEIANWHVEVVAGGHVGSPQHLYGRIKNCYQTRQEKASKEGDMIFYPHYCYDCGFSWIAKERLEHCRCGSIKTVNCYREKGETMTEKRKCIILDCNWPAVPYSAFCIQHRSRWSFTLEELEEQRLFMLKYRDRERHVGSP